MNCIRCGKWAGAHATLPGQPKDHLCMCQPQREWQGLTDEEIRELEQHYLFGGIEFGDDIGYWAVYRAIEAKLKEKNNG